MSNNNKITLFAALGAILLIAAFYIKSKYEIAYYVLLVAALIVLADAGLSYLLCKTKKSRRDGSERADPNEKVLPEYRRKKSMLTNIERKFYNTLKELYSEKYDILYQVPLNNVIDKLTQNAYRNELFRVVDFCLVSKDDFTPLLLIELNDSSHSRADRIERDKKVNEICSRAKMPIVAFKTSEISDHALIRKTVKANIAKK